LKILDLEFENYLKMWGVLQFGEKIPLFNEKLNTWNFARSGWCYSNNINKIEQVSPNSDIFSTQKYSISIPLKSDLMVYSLVAKCSLPSLFMSNLSLVSPLMPIPRSTCK